MPHFQQSVNKWLEAVGYLPDGFVVKYVDQVQMIPGTLRLEAMGWPDSTDALEEVQPLSEAEMTANRHAWLESLPETGRAGMSREAAVSGNVTSVLRHWYDNNYVFGGTYEENKQRARAFYQSFIDTTFMQNAHKVDFIEELNEYLASSHTGQELQDRLTWAKAVADVWKNEYRTKPELAHIRLVLVNAPVGNDVANGFAQIAVQYDCVMGFHNYDHWINGTRDPGSWEFYAGRFVKLDNNFKAAGYTVQWLFTETGPFSSAIDGWKHPNVHNGDINKYVESVKWFIDKLKTTAAWQQGRILGAHWFTSGGGSQWGKFETAGDDLVKVCQVIGQNWTAVPAPPPPPPPDPPTPPPTGNLLRNADFEGGWYDQATGQVPNEWEFDYYTGANPYDPAAYVKPETRVILKSQLPAGEWEQFGLTGSQAVKAFKGSGTWHGPYIQNLSQPLSKPGKATIRFFADLVASYNPKKYATYDPNNPAGQLRVNGSAWYLMKPGEINEPVFDVAAGAAQLVVEWRFNYPLANNAIFWGTAGLVEVIPMTWQEEAWAYAKSQKKIAFNKTSALQVAISADGFNIATDQLDYITPDGIEKKIAYVVDLKTGEWRVYWVDVPAPGQPWGAAKWFGDPAVSPPPTPF
jgi:hypothetical protein